jgi:hypothetical protein
MSSEYGYKNVESDGTALEAILKMKEDALVRWKNKPTEEKYREAIKQLLRLANLGTGGSLPAAMVLLSAYSSASFQIRIDSLGTLDTKNFDAAMTVIRGRIERGEEPHGLIENGSVIFQSMAEKYSRFNRQITE